MNRDRELLLRSLGDELTSAESEALESRPCRFLLLQPGYSFCTRNES